MKLNRPPLLLPILVLLLASLASLVECRRLSKRALRIFSAPPDSDQVYKGLNFPKHIDNVAQGGTIGLEYDARRLAGPVGSIWRRVKKLFRGGYKKDWNDILYPEGKKDRKPWEAEEEPKDEEKVEEVTPKEDEDVTAAGRDDDEVEVADYILNEINPRQKNNFNNFREMDRERVVQWR